MADRTSVSAAVGATVLRESRPEATISKENVASGNPLLWWLVVISVGCLLMAMVCAAALARVAPIPRITSSTVPTDQEAVRDVPTCYEIEGGGSLLRLHPAFAR